MGPLDGGAVRAENLRVPRSARPTRRSARPAVQPRVAPAPARFPYMVSALLHAIYCVECDSVLSTLYGVVKCMKCGSQYMVRRQQVSGGVVLSMNNLVLAETQYRIIDEVHTTDHKYFRSVDGMMQEVPKYSPLPSTRVLQYDDPRPDELASFVQHEVEPTTCILCKDPLEACLSIEVRRMKWKDVEHNKTHPVSKLDYTVVKSAPSFYTGRAHVHCVNNPIFAGTFETVHQAVVPPSKTQHMRQEHWTRIHSDDEEGKELGTGVMRQRRGETWRDVPDVVEITDD